MFVDFRLFRISFWTIDRRYGWLGCKLNQLNLEFFPPLRFSSYLGPIMVSFPTFGSSSKRLGKVRQLRREKKAKPFFFMNSIFIKSE